MHFDESIEIIENIKITNYKKEKKYLTDTLGYVLAERSLPLFPLLLRFVLFHNSLQ